MTDLKIGIDFLPDQKTIALHYGRLDLHAREKRPDLVSNRNGIVSLTVTSSEGGEPKGGAYGFSSDHLFILESIWVDPSIRGQDLGKRLLSQIEEVARERRCTRILLSTLSYYDSFGFMERMGFERFAGLDIPEHRIQIFYYCKTLV